MKKKQSIIKATSIIIFFTLITKILALFREVLMAAKFGSSMEADAYFIALTATGLMVGFLTSALNTTMIPILREIELVEGKKGKIEHTNNILNITLIISAILAIVGIIGAPIIIKLLASGFEGEQFKLAVKLTQIGFPVIFFGVTVGVFSSYLHSENRFTFTAAIGLPMSIVYIIYLLILTGKFGITGLMVTSVIAILSQVLMLIPAMKKADYRYVFKVNFKDEYLKKVLLLSVPVLIGVAINDINAIVDRTIASTLLTGSISALSYAEKLKDMILGVFIAAIITVIYPLLSKASNSEDLNGLKRIIKKGFDMILLIAVPATVGLIIFATPIVELVFQRGQFDALATQMTANALVFYSIGLVTMSLQLLLIRVYYSLQDTKTPMVIGIISVAFNIGLSLILVKYMDHSGLALATSISSMVATILLLWCLGEKIGSLGIKSYIKTLLKTGVASIIMGAISYLTYRGMNGLLGVGKFYNIVSLSTAILVAIIIYAALCYIFKVEEFRTIFVTIKNKFKKE